MDRGSSRIIVELFCLLFIVCYHLACSSNPCCSFPCQNKGVCMSEGNGYTCDCTETGYYGTDCEHAYLSTWLSNLFRPSRETINYLFQHFDWIWSIVNRVEFLRDFLLKTLYKRGISIIAEPPLYNSGHEYTTREAQLNRSYFAMCLPPVPKDCPTPFGIAGKKNPPDPEEVAEKLFKRKDFIPDSLNTSLMLVFWAQHFTHQFFKTDFKKGPGMTWGRHAFDVSNVYGDSVERENLLRSFTNGKLKSQIINGEEWPPFQKDANVTMNYPDNVPEDKRFALGHPFFALLPGLLMYSTIFLREHNRVCSVLKKEHPSWDDERLYHTAKLIITGEMMKVTVEDYINHLANYKLQFVYKPEIMFGENIPTSNRIHLAFDHLYHWHPLAPDRFDIAGTIYTMEDFMFNVEPLLKHGMSEFVDSMSKNLAGTVTSHNHGSHTMEVSTKLIKYERQLRMQSFNNYRRFFNMEPYKSFEELTGDSEVAKDMEEIYEDIEGLDFYVGIIMEKHMPNKIFGQTMTDLVTPFALKGIFAEPISTSHYWKPSTFGGNVGFDIVKSASLEKLFCQNIEGDCPLVRFRVPSNIAQKARETLKAKHDEL